MTLNLSSSEALNKVVGHEVTHVFEGTDQYEALAAAMKAFAAEKGIDWDTRVKEMQERYQNVKNADSEKELLADLVGEYLFTDSDFVKSLSTKNPNLFKRIYEEIKYLAKTFAGTKEARQLEKVKKAFADAYRAETKNPTADGGTKYSLNIKHTDGSVEVLADARNLTTEQAVSYLQQAKAGTLRRDTYIPVRKDTPQVIIDALEQVNEHVENCSLVMQVDKAQQSMKAEKTGRRVAKYGSNVRGHALSAEQIVEILNKLDDPSMIVYQTNRHDVAGNLLPNNVVVIVEYSSNETEGVAVIEFDSSFKQEVIGREFGDVNYHTVVTVFEPDVMRDDMEFDYAEELLSNPDNIELKIERRQPKGSATGANQPNTSNELPYNDSIRNPNGEVNTKFSLITDKRKAQQLAIVLENNPMWDDYHVGIRSVEDIRTWEEVLELDDEREGQFVWGDFSREDAENALKNNSVTVYSSHPISNGTFVSTSYTQAWEYAGGNKNSKVYSKEVPLEDVAWINGDEGQYARVEDGQGVNYSLSKKDFSIAPPVGADVHGKDIGYDIAPPIPESVLRANGVTTPSEKYKARESNQAILNLVDRVKNGETTKGEKVALHPVPDAVATRIQKLTGVDVHGFSVAIEARQIDHILKDHGENGRADRTMADPADIAKMEYALEDPDSIMNAGTTRAYVTNKNGKMKPADTVLYEKRNGDGSYYVVQAVPDTNKKTLYVVTAFIGPKGYKNTEAPQSTNANSPGATPVADSAAASNNSIPNSQPVVKEVAQEKPDELYGPWRMKDPLDIRVEKLWRMMLREEISEEEWLAQLTKADRLYQQRGERVDPTLERIREAYSQRAATEIKVLSAMVCVAAVYAYFQVPSSLIAVRKQQTRTFHQLVKGSGLNVLVHRNTQYPKHRTG